MGDSRRAIPYGLPYVLPLLVVAGVDAGGAGYWIGPIVAYALVPVCDEAWHFFRGAPRDAVPASRPPRTPPLVPMLYVPVELALLWWAVDVAGRESLVLSQWLGLVAGVGVATGAVGLTYAHELIHGRRAFERRLGEVLLLAVGYLPFAIEHVQGHHANLATDHDPASAPRGMSVYRFIPRAVAGTVRGAWAIETRRLARHGRPAAGIHNRMLWSAALPIALGALIAAAFGPGGLAFFVAQATLAVCLLEVINYLQHYGLRRGRSDGGVARIEASHSWDCDRALTALLLLNLSRHSDHHLHGDRGYGVLRLRSDAPTLPAGYPAMMLLALVPPAFFAVMHRRLEEWRARQDSNLWPPAPEAGALSS